MSEYPNKDFLNKVYNDLFDFSNHFLNDSGRTIAAYKLGRLLKHMEIYLGIHIEIETKKLYEED